MGEKEFSTEIGGKKFTAAFSDLAEQADGSVVVTYGNSTVLATVVMSENKREDLDYFPLTVDYEERFYAAGQILGSRFFRREGRPSEEAVLSGRAVDRTIRPLFDHSIRNEVQVVITILSIDEDDPDTLAINAASLALLTSDIPWKGPVGAVRIGKMKDSDRIIINPTYTEREDGNMLYDALVCGRDGNINMTEVGAREADEKDIAHTFDIAVKELLAIQKFQEEIAKKIGKEKRVLPKRELPDDLVGLFKENIEIKLPKAVMSGNAGKKTIHELKKEWTTLVSEQLPDALRADAEDYFESRVNELLHYEAVERGKRPDGRGMDEMRELRTQAGNISPMLHGAGLFYRGGTHVLSVLTLGGPQDSLIIDSMEEQEGKRRFLHHYNFPPFSSGETGRIGGFNRRMIGHGALAEKALLPVIPKKEEFPYTIRLVSECFASNGSTSMGSVCAGTLALMDGGVPITRPVAGIAIGLMLAPAAARKNAEQTRKNAEISKYKILTDIQGPEDQHGDMDFKVAGTRKGITAIQMDVKVDGIPASILTEALKAGQKARLAILDRIEKEIPSPRPNISPRAPEIITITIGKDQIGSVIGPGGKIINGIKESTGVDEIQIEEDGTVFITGRGGTAEKAKVIIEDMTRKYKAGERFEGEVTRITNFGAFVKINHNAEGLVHISEIAPFRIENVGQALSIGDTVPVIIKEIDEQNRINLSIKQADPNFIKNKNAGRGHR